MKIGGDSKGLEYEYKMFRKRLIKQTLSVTINPESMLMLKELTETFDCKRSQCVEAILLLFREDYWDNPKKRKELIEIEMVPKDKEKPPVIRHTNKITTKEIKEK